MVGDSWLVTAGWKWEIGNGNLTTHHQLHLSNLQLPAPTPPTPMTVVGWDKIMRGLVGGCNFRVMTFLVFSIAKLSWVRQL